MVCAMAVRVGGEASSGLKFALLGGIVSFVDLSFSPQPKVWASKLRKLSR